MPHRMPRLVVPLVNEVFGHAYPADTPVIPFNSEHETPLGARVEDSVFRIRDKIYHVECQSTSDTTMAVRMVEYDFAIALGQAVASGEPYEMDFPSSCVLFLRHDDSTPDVLTIRVNLPDGESFDYHTKVMKAQRYDSDELFAKHLLLLLPFYLMRYKRLLAAIAADDDRTARLLEECAELRDRLDREAEDRGMRKGREEGIAELLKLRDLGVDESLIAAAVAALEAGGSKGDEASA